MIRYFLKTFRAHLMSGLSLYALTILGVALGVASVVAVQIINRNAVGAFEAGIRAVTGDSDLIVEGTTPTFPEDQLALILSTPGVKDAWPLLRAQARSEAGGDSIEILGLDLTRIPDDWLKSDFRIADALRVRGWMGSSQALADRLGWKAGERVPVSIGSRSFELVVGTIIDFERYRPQSSSRVVIMDISQVQALAGLNGQLHQVDVRLQQEAGVSEVLASLRSRLGEGFQILTPGEEKQRAGTLLAAFRLNLTALSLISLFVGVFLIYSSTQASVVRRRTEFGLLRSLGATAGQIVSLILAEVLILGFLGVLLGIPLGYWAALSQLKTVNSMLTNIYLLAKIEQIQVPPGLYIVAVGIGVGSALLAAVFPTLEMTRRDTRALMSAYTLRERVSGAAFPLFLGGLGLAGLALVLCLVRGFDWKPAGFILGLFVLAALPLISPFSITALFSHCRVRDFGLTYSIRSVADRVQTISFSVASLAIAVAMLIGITLMIGSFRETVRVWVETSIVADLYITTKSWKGTGSAAALDESSINAIASRPGIRGLDRIRTLPVYLKGQRILVSGVDLSVPGSEARYPLLEGEPREAYRALRRGTGILISEPLARKRYLKGGDLLRLPTPTGTAVLTIAGIVYDYTTEWGLIVMNLEVMDRILGGGPVNSLAVYLTPETSSAHILESLRADTTGLPLVLSSNQDLRRGILRIFDETFAVVRILQVMSLLIAVCGITLTLIVLARERVSELALYRAIGASRRQIFRVFVGKGVAIALLGTVLGLLAGTCLALILIFVINRAYFGWTIQVFVPVSAVLWEILLIFGSSILASIYPSLRASRVPATELSREDF